MKKMPHEEVTYRLPKVMQLDTSGANIQNQAHLGSELSPQGTRLHHFLLAEAKAIVL